MRQPFVVPVYSSDIFSSGLIYTTIKRSNKTLILLVNEADATISFLKALNDFFCIVNGAVVYDNIFKISKVLR